MLLTAKPSLVKGSAPRPLDNNITRNSQMQQFLLY